MSDNVTVKKMIEDMVVDNMRDFIALFMYQGFTPDLVYAHLANAKSTQDIEDNTYRSDMKTLLTMAAILGNYNDHNAQKISDEGRKSADAVFARWRIHKGKIGSNKKAITLPRLQSAFPVPSHKISMKCGEKNYNNALGCNGLPKEIKSSVFAAIVPSNDNEASKAILFLYTCYTTEQTLTISDEKDLKRAFEKQKQYTEIAHNSAVPTIAERKEYFSKLTFNYEAMKSVYIIANGKLGVSRQTFPVREVFSANSINLE